MLWGIGNEDKADDGVGPYVASLVKFDGWQSINCGTVPENFSGVVRRIRPELLVIVDAVQMNAKPGEIRIIQSAQIRETNVGTHAMALSQLVDYISDMAGKIILIGIQPASLNFGEPMCAEVREAAVKVVEMVRSMGQSA